MIAENTTTGTNIRTLGKGSYVRLSSGITEWVFPAKISPEYLTLISRQEKKRSAEVSPGLAICDSIIKYHNGLISVESVVGVGTSFMLYLSSKP